MFKRFFAHRLNEHVVAIIGAVVVHVAVIAWVMPSMAAPVPIKQQIIQISMVAPSIVAQPHPVPPVVEQKVETPPVVAASPKPEAPKTVKKVVKKPAPPKPEKKIEPVVQPIPERKIETVVQHAPTPPTSGLQSPDATQKFAARTEPVFDAAYLRNPPPVYPPPARRSGVQGKVMLLVDVTPQGLARTVQVRSSSGSPLLDDAALNAVKQWHFVPAKRGEEAIEAAVLVPVDFKLN